MKLNIGQVLKLQSDIVQVLVKNGIIDSAGNFVDNLQAELKAFAEIEQLLKANGLVVPAKVDQIVQLLPILLQLVK